MCFYKFQYFVILFGFWALILLTNIDGPRNPVPKKRDNRTVIDQKFYEKKTKLYSELEKLNKLPSSKFYEKRLGKRITVNRRNIFQDSFKALNQATDKELLNIRINFQGENDAYDIGLQIEWFDLLAKEMYDPVRGLFKYSSNDTFAAEINPLSHKLEYFKFVGKITALSICLKKPMNVHLSRPLLKSILNIPIEVKDIEKSDPEYYKNLMEFKKNPKNSNLYFQTSEEGPDGKIVTVNLIPGGSETKVSRRNVNDFIQLLIKRKYKDHVQKQMEAFLDGFKFLISVELIKDFNPLDLESLLCGVPVIDLEDWKKYTIIDYEDDEKKRLYQPTIKWFWQIIESFSDEEREKVLLFVTGSSRLPINGFKEMKDNKKPFTISTKYMSQQRNFLPYSNVCLNTLYLTPYDNKQIFRRALTTAINEADTFEKK